MNKVSNETNRTDVIGLILQGIQTAEQTFDDQLPTIRYNVYWWIIGTVSLHLGLVLGILIALALLLGGALPS